MDLFSRDDLRTLMGNRRTPCISLFMPTTRGVGHEDNKRWKNVVREGEERLSTSGSHASEIKELLRPAQAMLENGPFWQNVSDGLAVFISPETFRSFRLPMAVGEQMVVADHFHIRPVLPLIVGDGRFYILALSQKNVRLLQATHHTVGELELQGVPRSFQEALNYDDVEVSRTVHSHPAAGGKAGSREAIAHGHGTGIDSAKEGLLEFVQKVNRGLERLLQNEDAPLVLVGVEYELAIYRQANSYKHLVAEEVAGNPDRLSPLELRDRAWVVVQPYFQEARQKTAALYRQMAGTGRTSNDLAEIVAAAYQGQVQFLFVPFGREPQTAHWGRFDPTTQKVENHERPEPGDEDLVNLAIVLALTHKGTIYALEPGEIPNQPPLAAVFWLPVGERSSKRTISP